MSGIRTIKVGPDLLQMPVIARAYGAIYIRIPQDLQREKSDGCTCNYCRTHPDQPPMWDTLVVNNGTGPLEAGPHPRPEYLPPKAAPPIYRDCQWTWTVHMPDPEGFFKAAMKRREQAIRREQAASK
jgi:hypothetical protein